MTDADLDAKAALQSRRMAAWYWFISGRVDAKLSDAHSHAIKAITDTLKRVPDGRATLRHAWRSPSARAATARMDELLDWLAGPSVASTEGAVRDAREAFYREAFDAWKPFIDPRLWIAPDAEPTLVNVRKARTVVLHGMDLRTEIGGPIGMAKRNLMAALAVAGRQESTGRDSAQVLKAWHRRATDAILLTVKIALSDSQVDADVQAGRDLVHPDNLE